MDIRSLTIYQHLARNLHFAKTAEDFHMSPSTLSRLVQRMEQQIGCALLLRDNRSVQLTHSGEKLLDFADQQLNSWHELKQGVSQQETLLTGKLNIFCSVTAAYSHLPQLLDRFRQQHPSVEIMLATGDPADSIHQIKENKVDIALAAKPEKLMDKIYFSSIAKIPMAIIAPTLSNQIQQQLRQPQIDWRSIPIILPEHGPARKRFDRWFARKHQGKPNIYATVAGHEAIVSMVALGCGVGIAPKVVVENSPVKNRVETISNQGEIEPFELGICCQKHRMDQPIIHAFLKSLI